MRYNSSYFDEIWIFLHPVINHFQVFDVIDTAVPDQTEKKGLQINAFNFSPVLPCFHKYLLHDVLRDHIVLSHIFCKSRLIVRNKSKTIAQKPFDHQF